MLEWSAGHEYYYFLDGYAGYNQILIAAEDQKTTFTAPSKLSPTVAYSLGYAIYAMHLLRSKDACTYLLRYGWIF